MPAKRSKPKDDWVRIGEAAELLGVSVDTLRRWTASGRLSVRRSAGRQRLRALADGRRVQEVRRKRERPAFPPSPRNRSPGARNPFEMGPGAPVVAVPWGAEPPRPSR